MRSFTVLVGASKPRTALRAAAVHAADTLAAHTGMAASADVIDLTTLGPALLADHPGGDVREAVSRVENSDVVLVASPQAHGTYTGVLKVFLDRLPDLGLAQTVAVPMAVVNDLRNGHGVEEDLRVLLADLGAWVLDPGLLLGESEIDEPLSVIGAWAELAAPRLWTPA